jgi:hypothetical protein
VRCLVLFFTQAQSGAPGYLSRQGEEAAQHLAETLESFLCQSLQLDLLSQKASRAQSLSDDVRWRLYKGPENFAGAVQASLGLFSEVLLLSGDAERTLNTTRVVASQLGLPVCVDARLDGSSSDKKAKGLLHDALEALTNLQSPLRQRPNPPKALVVGTSVDALVEWIAGFFPPEKLDSLKEILRKSTQEGQIPTVFSCGFDGESVGVEAWLFD